MLTHVGKVRRHNEDACLDRSDIGMWCVADGMGGHAAGDVASRMVVDRLARVDRNGSLAELVEAAESAILEANDLLFKLSTRHNQTSGTTVVVLLAHGRHCVFVWAGDSRIYRLRDGEIKQMTTDHSQIEAFIEQGLLSREEARDHPAGNMVTRAVGAAESLYLDMDIDELAADDCYLLCSDGL
ncbi:MAG: protein phosphatase 2C domain-containing protein, partial [Gammaproteobacteria bacterium]|nr:protein phosphatase 2C domain-containing protein [Gammaproteobacteria bacterium]